MKRSIKVGMMGLAILVLGLNTGCGPMGALMGPVMGGVGSLGGVARIAGSAAGARPPGAPPSVSTPNPPPAAAPGGQVTSNPAFDQMMAQQQAARADQIAVGARQDSIDNGWNPMGTGTVTGDSLPVQNDSMGAIGMNDMGMPY